MNKKIAIFILLIFFSTKIIAIEKYDYFKLGKKHFESGKINKAIFYFEKDIVRNTKNTQSYLYLAESYKIKKKNDDFEKNLNTVLILDPKNEEALYLLIKKKIDDGDYILAKKKIKILDSTCIKICNKKNQLKELIKKNKN